MNTATFATISAQLIGVRRRGATLSRSGIIRNHLGRENRPAGRAILAARSRAARDGVAHESSLVGSRYPNRVRRMSGNGNRAIKSSAATKLFPRRHIVTVYEQIVELYLDT